MKNHKICYKALVARIISASWERRLKRGFMGGLTGWTNCLILLLFISIASGANAQVRSDLPPFDVTYESYRTPYECYSAAARVSYTIPNTPGRDTLPAHAPAARPRVREQVKAVAEKCIPNITIDSLDRVELLEMMRLLLLVDRDSDVDDMVRRLLIKKDEEEAADSSSDEESRAKGRADIYFLTATTYLNAIPARVSAALPYLDSVAKVWPDNRLFLARHYYNVFNKAREIGDTLLLQESILRLKGVQKRLLPQESRNIAGHLFSVQQYITVQDRYDSLRKSSEAYIALQVAQKENLEVKELLLGTVMNLEGEFRFPDSAVFPVPGKVNLVVVPGALPATSIFPMLRRLKDKYSEIEVVYSDLTRGTFGRQLMEPAQEAEMRRKWVQEFMKMPFLVTIEKSEPWRLPEPDRRLIYGATPNIQKYGNRLWLIDKFGKIVHYSLIDKKQEAEFDNLIGALLKQH